MGSVVVFAEEARAIIDAEDEDGIDTEEGHVRHTCGGSGKMLAEVKRLGNSVAGGSKGNSSGERECNVLLRV